MFAIIRIAGRQFRVQEGVEVLVNRLPGENNAPVEGIQVLMVGEGEAVKVGHPTVEGASVDATLLRHTQGPKIRIFKYKPKKNYRRRAGARAQLSLVRINKIQA